MTLNTSIRILAPVDVHEVIDAAKGLLGADDNYVMNTEACWWDSNVTAHRAMIGQGYPAILTVRQANTGIITDQVEPGQIVPPPAALEVSFDTTYSYRGRHNSGCGDLHAWLVREFGKWATSKGLPWVWQNEYTGTWHTGFTNLSELGNPVMGRLDTVAA